VVNSPTILDVARDYVGRGWKVVPVPEKRKDPVIDGWQNLDLGLKDLPAVFKQNGTRPNVGVLQGKPSGGLIDVDLDTDEAVALGALWLPRTGAVFGRAGKRRSHWLYRSSNDLPKTTQFKWPGAPREPGEKAMLVELRSTGSQTVFPGSVHPSGEPIEWGDDGDPATVDVAELERTVRWIAAGALLVRFWSEGARNHLSLALAGALLRAAWSVEEAGDFIEGVAQAAGDPEWSKRRGQCVASTARKISDGANVIGVPALAEQLGDQAVVKALVAWLGLGRSSTPHTSSAPPPDAPGLPSIDAGIQALPIVTVAAWNALREANTPPRFFEYAGTPVRLVRDGTGRLDVEALDDHGLRHEVARVARWYQWKKDRTTGLIGEVDARPPLDVMRDMLATPSEKRPLPALTRIVQAPIFSPGGDLLTTPGYHPSARIYYDPPPGLTLPAVPARPTKADVDAARQFLVTELLGDFPFISEAERAHAVSLLLLPFVRDMIAGSTPLHLIDAPTPGSGKGLLADVLLLPALGASTHVMSPANDDDEWRKRLTAALGNAPGAIQIDNLVRTFTSPDLAAALTMPEWSDRILGQSRIVRYPVRCVWLCTANNIAVSTEIARRSVRIRLNPQQDRPWERQTSCFRKPALKEWAKSVRGSLIGAALTLVNAWLAEGRPRGERTLGSFEAWSRIMGGILNVASIPGFLGNAHEFYESADTEGAVQRRLIAAWWAAFQDTEVGTAELFPIAEAVDGLSLGRSTTERGQRTSLGVYLGRMKDRVFGDYRVVKGAIIDNRQLWRLQKSAPTTPGGRPTPHDKAPSVPDAMPVNPSNGSNLSNLSNLSVPNVRAHAGAHTHACIQDGVEKVTEVTEVTSSTAIDSPPRALRPCSGGCGELTPDGWMCKPCRTGQARPTDTAIAKPEVVRDEAPVAPYTMLKTARDVEDMLTDVRGASVVGIDTETTGLDALTDRLRLIQIATPEVVYMLDAFALDPRLLAPLLQGDGPLLVGHNLKFDLRFLESAGLSMPVGRRLFDTMLASQLLGAGTLLKHNLAAVAERALGLTIDKTEQKSDWSGPLRQEQLSYAARDAAILPALAVRLRDEVDSAGLQRVCDVEMRALPTIAWIEQTGVPFDAAAWTPLANAVRVEQADVEQELTEATGTGGLFEGSSSVNWGSSPQVAALLRGRGHTVTSTDEAALLELAEAGEPLATLLLRHRDAAKRASTYGADYLKWVNPRTARIHAGLLQLGSDAGRMSCRNPNLQQVPRDKQYRACIRPDEGRVLIKADYAQIELRLAAEIAGDTRLIEAFQRGDDLHAVTARTVLGKTDVTKGDRQAAKAVNFGLLYGMGAEGLRAYAKHEYGVQWSLEEAAAVRGKFFDTYRGLKAWHRSQPDGTLDTYTVAGRRRSGITSFTQKLNSPVQGSGADGLKAALGLLGETRDSVSSAVPINVVHDEIVVECDRDQAEEARAWVMEAMRSGMETVLHHVPAEVEATICGDWSGTPLDSPTT